MVGVKAITSMLLGEAKRAVRPKFEMPPFPEATKPIPSTEKATTPVAERANPGKIAPPAAAKEPWQMTYAEASRTAPKPPVNPHRKGTVAYANFERTKLRDAEKFQIHHKESVAQALAEGKPVPAEVLKDYPDLARATPPQPRDVGKGCLPCSRDHFSAVYGVLDEALRFARREPEGLAHPEVQERLALAEKELNVWERVDMTPDKIQALPEGERQEVRDWVAEGSRLRQRLGQVSTVDELEKLAVRAKEIYARARLLTLPQGLRERVEALARKVDKGEITVEQAKESLQQTV